MTIAQVLPKLFSRGSKSDASPEQTHLDGNPLFLRLAMAVAFVSMAFEGSQDLIISTFTTPLYASSLSGLEPVILTLFAAILAINARFLRVSVLIVLVVAIPELLNLMGLANHTLLAFWCIAPAVLFRDWTSSKSYAVYLRVTFGMVMIAACVQKLIAGTYINGAYLHFLITTGKTSAQWFGFICSESSEENCAAIVVASNFILVWQFIVGVFLIIGWKNIIVLIVEVGFLLGAGLFADEFNFQVLNIALLSIVFRVGLHPIAAAGLVLVIIGDIWGVGQLVTAVASVMGGQGP